MSNNMSSTAGSLLKYKNQMVCNSNPDPDIACYGDTISTLRQKMDIKEFKASLLSTSFHQATSPHFIMVLS